MNRPFALIIIATWILVAYCFLSWVKTTVLSPTKTEALQTGEEVKSEPKDVHLDIGECFVLNYKYENCTPNAPDWENRDNALIVYKVVDIGIKKYLVLYKGYYCDLTTEAGSQIYADTWKIDSTPKTKVDCPERLMSLSKEDVPEL